MSNKYSRKPRQEIKGSFIYKDEKNRTIYSNPFMKNYGYQLFASDNKKFSLYQMRLPATVLVIVSIIVFFDNYLVALLSGISLYLISTIIFLFVYLPKQTRVNFDKPKMNSFINKSVEKQTNFRLILILIAALALSGLTIYNAKTNNYKGAVLIANYLLAGASFVVFMFNLYIMILKTIKEKR